MALSHVFSSKQRQNDAHYTTGTARETVHNPGNEGNLIGDGKHKVLFTAVKQTMPAYVVGIKLDHSGSRGE